MPFDPHRGNSSSYNNMYAQSTVPQTKSPKNSKAPIVIGVVAVLLLSIVAVGVFVLPNMAKTEDASNQSAVTKEPEYVETEIFDIAE